MNLYEHGGVMMKHTTELDSSDTKDEQFMMESMPVGVSKHSLDANLTFLSANASFYHLLGYQASEFSLSFKDLKSLFAHDMASYEQFVHQLEDVDEAAIIDISLPKKNGELLHVRLSGNRKTEHQQSVLYIVYNDISDLFRQHTTLLSLKNERTRNFEWMMDEYPGNVYICDMDNYELLYLNPSACKTLHNRKEKLLGRKCYEAIQGRSSPCPFCTNAYLTTDASYEWEFYNPALERDFMIKNRKLQWGGRNARIELSSDMDSTEYKLAKKDLERDAILRTIPGGLARIDASDMKTVLWYGGKFLEMIGHTAEQFKNELDCQSTSYIHPDDFDSVQKVMDESRELNIPTIMETRIVNRDGSVKILTITFSYVSGRDSWDGIPSFYSVGIDVTKDRKEQERQHQALKDAYQTASIANSAKTNFLSSMSHDIRTPMNAIIGMAMIAQASMDEPKKVLDCLHKINISSRHLLSLINEVLDISKIESGKVDLVLEQVDLSELVQHIYDMSKPLATSKHQNVKVLIEGVKHEKIITDGDRLKQIFMNLLSNAIKYTPEGGNIVFQIKEIDSLLSGKGFFEFSFMDDGIGMSEDFLPNLFKPFARAEDTRISKIQGTGLGLAIVENIVRMMNGTIEVYTKLGEGSRFVVAIPLEYYEDVEKTDEELLGQSVLVVDDDQDVCESASLLLRELGMNGTWVLSGKEAIVCVEESYTNNTPFFAVIIDWKMPEMDGLETIKAMRKKFTKDIPIIIVSAYDLSDIENEFIEAGADAFITKPLFKSKMLHVLELFCTSNAIARPKEIILKEDSMLCGKRILLVEDNDLNREIATELLSMQGVIVESATHGKEAVEMFEQTIPQYYDAILMDIQMPVMNGYEATRIIRNLDREDAASIPIIALTANVFVSDLKAAQNAGMSDHIAKPIDIECLVRVISKYMN